MVPDLYVRIRLEAVSEKKEREAARGCVSTQTKGSKAWPIQTGGLLRESEPIPSHDCPSPSTLATLGTALPSDRLIWPPTLDTKETDRR